MSAPIDIPERIREKALEMGFIACGFANPNRLDHLENPFSQWLDDGYAGTMEFLHRNRDLRLDPAGLLPGVKTVISLAASYHDPTPPANSPFSRYARIPDYHRVLKIQARALAEWMNGQFGSAEYRIFTDSAPLFEKEWARRAGLGWIGKHGLLIHPEAGSWIFLCEILTCIEIPADRTPIPDRCGSCTRCMDACPTQAIVSPGRIDPRKCISYLTIETKEEIPESFSGKWNHTVYGCDICQEVCPWNQHVLPASMPEFYPSGDLTGLTMEDLENLKEEEFSALFDGTPIQRGGLFRILRNFAFVKDVK